MASEFCPYCGEPLAGESGFPTCRRSHTRKFRGVCEEIAERMVSAVLSVCEGHDPGFPVSARRFEDAIWPRLFRPVPAPDCSIERIGNARAVFVLASLYLDPTTAPESLDGELYGRLVANGWVDFSPSVHLTIENRARATA